METCMSCFPGDFSSTFDLTQMVAATAASDATTSPGLRGLRSLVTGALLSATRRQSLSIQHLYQETNNNTSGAAQDTESSTESSSSSSSSASTTPQQPSSSSSTLAGYLAKVVKGRENLTPREMNALAPVSL